MGRTLTPTEFTELVADRRCTVCLADWMADPGFLCDCCISRDVNAAEREEARLRRANQVRCELALEDGRTGDCFCAGHVPVPYTELRAGRPARSGIDWVRRQDFSPAEWGARHAEYTRSFDDEEMAS